MASFLVAVGSFVSGLLDIEVPGLGITMGYLMLGLWLLYGVGRVIMSLLLGEAGDTIRGD